MQAHLLLSSVLHLLVHQLHPAFLDQHHYQQQQIHLVLIHLHLYLVNHLSLILVQLRQQIQYLLVTLSHPLYSNPLHQLGRRAPHLDNLHLGRLQIHPLVKDSVLPPLDLTIFRALHHLVSVKQM